MESRLHDAWRVNVSQSGHLKALLFKGFSHIVALWWGLKLPTGARVPCTHLRSQHWPVELQDRVRLEKSTAVHKQVLTEGLCQYE